MTANTQANWIAVDWGTSNLRAWAMTGSGHPLAEATSDAGMSSLAQDAFAPALQALLDSFELHEKAPVVACGMVGSRQGWVEAPYNTVPCRPFGQGFAHTHCGPHPVHIIAGLRQMSPADVMRGEETQIAGFLALNPDWDGVICLPGTHTKWVEVSAGEVVSFQTFMTGELFALLGTHSVLRHSVTPDAQGKDKDGWDKDAFAAAVEDAMSKPERLAARLFTIRANDLLHGALPATSRATASGQLIGAELASAKPYWLGRQIAVIGAQPLAGHYCDALAAQGVPATLAKAHAMTLAGLTAAYRQLKDAT